MRNLFTFHCSALARVHLDTVWGHQLNRQPLDLYGLVTLTKVDCIGKAMERKAEQVKFTGGLATPGINVCQAFRCLPPIGAGKDPTPGYSFLLLGYLFPLRGPFNKQTNNTYFIIL